MKSTDFPIVKEGLLIVGSLCLVTVVLAFFVPAYLTLLLILIDLFVLFFFRNPKRTIPSSEGCVIAPADGKIVQVGECTEERFSGEEFIKVSIFMSVFNVHVNRIPISGRITNVVYSKGKFYSANLSKASLLNENNALFLETEGHKKVLVIQIAGLIARRIVCWINKGDDVKKGQRFGLICFGSRVDVFLPRETRIEVTVGQRVRGGETILGHLS